jgi:hypothetical protein
VPRKLGRDAALKSGDVTADGELFLVDVPVIKSSSAPLSVVVNWAAALKK